MAKIIIRGLKLSNHKVIMIRWLGAFGRCEPKLSALYEKENNCFKSFECFFNENIFNNNLYFGSNIKAQIGLLIKSYDKSKFYPCDAWTKEQGDRYINNRILPSVKDVEYVYSFIKKFHSMQWDIKIRNDYISSGKYIEGTANNLKYKAIVIKRNANNNAIKIAKIYSEVMGLPIIKLEDVMKM